MAGFDFATVYSDSSSTRGYFNGIADAAAMRCKTGQSHLWREENKPRGCDGPNCRNNPGRRNGRLKAGQLGGPGGRTEEFRVG
ncbi:hypothetical protein JX265_011503 [Neoarthrinium moseri]|uniref:Uncharacterized protein n=1 Tax=Neoarthrinium moseri TaxID=1658444 RepID=A0A9P9WBT8_9PEZI|nr:uncharacterized protein JN550_008470 [Neoarthrinium moseri]KAI1848644.1 hypothetical protein JX266_005503 [Neoarthrinium moseri]KAI1856544.1 hypothetical protein JX265_011503 [Neoarthrinium moseri]KAI1865422.1 hypothetical protein JN550_008470 [Neoarthrinium moseri]